MQSEFVEQDTRNEAGTFSGRSLRGLPGWIALCFSASFTAVFVDTGPWYDALAKPSWNPPSWLFGPVWTVLYAMMAVAAWQVWRLGGWRLRRVALCWFLGQWFLNVIWTPLFFGLHRIDLALLDISLLWLALGITMGHFRQVRTSAALLLLPYFLWVSFALLLNATLWHLNQ